MSCPLRSRPRRRWSKPRRPSASSTLQDRAGAIGYGCAPSDPGARSSASAAWRRRLSSTGSSRIKISATSLSARRSRRSVRPRSSGRPLRRGRRPKWRAWSHRARRSCSRRVPRRATGPTKRRLSGGERPARRPLREGSASSPARRSPRGACSRWSRCPSRGSGRSCRTRSARSSGPRTRR